MTKIEIIKALENISRELNTLQSTVDSVRIAIEGVTDVTPVVAPKSTDDFDVDQMAALCLAGK